MPARPPQWGFEQPSGPDDGELPTAAAELVIEVSVRSEGREVSKREQVTPAPDPANRIANMLRRAGPRAVLRIVAHPKDGSQMIAAVERISVMLTWAVTVTVTLGIVTAASLSASAMIAIIGLELTGLTIVLLATRWRRRKDEPVPPTPAAGGR